MEKLRITTNNALKSEKSMDSQRWHQIIMATLIFVAGNAFDYMFTIHGITSNSYKEGNPVAQGYIDSFGLEKGLLLLKALLGSFIIFGVIIFDRVCKKKGIKFRSEFILYAGAIATILAGSLWMTKI